MKSINSNACPVIVKIPLSRDQFAIIDERDSAIVGGFKWSLHDGKHKYAKRLVTKNGSHKTVLMHRLILEFPDALIDHRNGNGLDNRRCNLRLATRAQNNANKRIRWGRRKYKGVINRNGRWGASITVSGRPKWLGTFETDTEAAMAYNVAALAAFGEFAFLNQI